MNTATSTDAFDPAAGRLVAPRVDWPISSKRFAALCEAWRRNGFWLSLWTADGEFVTSDPDGGSFWQIIAKPDGRFLHRVKAWLAETTAEAGEKEGIRQTTVGGPWRTDLPLVAVSIVDRRRRVGAVIASCLSGGEPGEDFDRLCSECDVDRTWLAQQRETMPSIAAADLSDRAALLTHTVRQARDGERRNDEIAVLTNNLENTYEELHLIYEISSQMGIPQSPESLLTRVGRELLAVTRAAGIGFVLPWHDYETAPEKKTPDGRRAGQWKHVVQIGEGAPTDADLIRVTEQLLPSLAAKPRHLLLNKATTDHEGLAWARPWLRHLVAYPMQQDGTDLGVCYTINCTDPGDFTSVDVQLYRAVVDRVTAALHNQHLYDDLADLLLGMLHALVNSVDAKDPYTFGHSGRVAFFSRALAQSMGLSRIECERVYLSGLLHDIGKIGVPDAVLTKPGRLTRDEFDLLKKHPEIGQRILSRVRQIQDLVPGVLYHHERIDGRGYPHGLAGRSIPLFGRIICIADSFDAMTSNRTYRAALPVPMAISEIRRCSGTQFDPMLAEYFLAANPQMLFDAAIEDARGDAEIGRIGALSRRGGEGTISVATVNDAFVSMGARA